LIQGG